MNNRSAKRVPGVPSPAYIESLYRTMAAALGPTGWWPAETTFEIMVGAVLKLAIMGPAHLQELIRPSGFYVNKSKTVQSLSRWYVERCGASPEGAADIPDAELRTELLGLFGIGGETADDLTLYVFSRRTFVADTYARRLFAFLGFDVPTGYLAFHKAYSPVVLDASLSVKDLQEFHGLIDEFGKAYRDDAAKSESFLGGWRA